MRGGGLLTAAAVGTVALAGYLTFDFATDGPFDRIIDRELFDKDRIPLLASLIGALCTLAAAGFGILGSYLAFMRTPRRLRRIEHKLAYTEEQLSGLYGPLLGEVKVLQAAYKELLLRLNRKPDEVAAIMRGDPPLNPYQYLGGQPSQDQKEWARFTREFFLPGHGRIVQLISSKQHLIGPEPMYFLDEFLAHEAEYRVRFTTWESSGAPDTRPGAPWPSRFQTKVERKIHLLKLLQRKYRLQLANDAVPAAVREGIARLIQESRDPEPGMPVQ